MIGQGYSVGVQQFSCWVAQIFFGSKLLYVNEHCLEEWHLSLISHVVLDTMPVELCSKQSSSKQCLLFDVHAKNRYATSHASLQK